MTVSDGGLQIAFALRLMRKTPGLTAVARNAAFLVRCSSARVRAWGPARRALAVYPIETMHQE